MLAVAGTIAGDQKGRVCLRSTDGACLSATVVPARRRRAAIRAGKAASAERGRRGNKFAVEVDPLQF